MKKLLLSLLLLCAPFARAQQVFGTPWDAPSALKSLPAGSSLYLGSINATVDSSGNLVVTGCTGCSSGSSGTVTSVSITTANGVSGTVATATSTPAITLTLGAITPTSTNGGVLAATMAFLDATSSVQTQLNAKAPLASPTFTGTVTIPNGGVFGTPTSATLTNATGLPVSTGVSGLGSNVASFLATPSSANFFAAITDETGSGLVPGATSPTLTTPHVTQILDGNGNVFLTSSATSTAVDSVTITNAATANPATVTVATTGTDTNVNLVLGTKGTGVLQFPTGTLANPTICGSLITTSCFWSKTNFPFAYSNQTSNLFAIGTTAGSLLTMNSNGVFGIAASSDATATKDIGLSRVSANVLGVGTGAAGTSGGYLQDGGHCALTAGATISVTGTAVTVCQFTLPAAASNWHWYCQGSWALTAGTTPTLSIGMNSSTAPTKETASAKIYTSTALAGITAANVSSTSSGAVNILTSGTITTAATFFPWEANGTIQASNAAGGTFTITATGTGTSVAGSVGTDTSCTLFVN